MRVQLALGTPSDFALTRLVLGHEGADVFFVGIDFFVVVPIVVIFTIVIIVVAFVVAALITLAVVVSRVIAIAIVVIIVRGIAIIIFIALVAIFTIVIVIIVVSLIVRASGALETIVVGIGAPRTQRGFFLRRFDCLERRLGNRVILIVAGRALWSGFRLCNHGTGRFVSHALKSCSDLRLPCAGILFAIVGSRSNHDRFLCHERPCGNGACGGWDAAALPHSFKESDTSRHRNIERSHMPEHRQRDDVVAMFPHEATNSTALASQYKNDGALVVDLVPAFLARAVVTHDPVTALLQILERLNDVSDARDLHVVEGTSCGSRGGVGQRRGVPIRHDESIGSGCFDASNHGAEIPRIFHSVQKNEKGRSSSGGLQLIEGHERLLGDDGKDALMPLPLGGAIKRFARFETKRNAPLARATNHFENALVAHSFGHDNAFDRARTGG